MKTNPLWTPSETQIKNSNLTQFIQKISERYRIHLDDKSLYTWSIKHPELFWKSVWDFCEIKGTSGTTILTHPQQMLNAQWFKDGELNFAENLLRHRSKKPALIYCDERGCRRQLSFDELYEQVEQWASAFQYSQLKPQDRVVGLLPNLPETVIAMLATTSLGATWSGCSPDFGLQAILDRFEQIQPSILVTVDGYVYNGKRISILDKVEALIAALPYLNQIIIVPFLDQKPNLPKEAILLENYLNATPVKPLTFEKFPFNHPLYILYSSGTTGLPKCIVHGTGGTLIQHLKDLVLHTNLSPNDIFFYFTTCSWMMWHWLISGLAVGSTLILYEGSPFFPKKESLFDLIDREKITIFGTSAKYLAAIEKHELNPKKTHDLLSLQTILSTGSPLLPEQFDYVYEHIKSDLRLSSISGGTDIVSCFALGNPNLPVYRGELQCRGLGMAVEIFNEEGQSVKQEQGELVCTAPFPCMPIYFWNDPEGIAYQAAYFSQFPGVWSQGDRAELTKHGGLIIHGRSDATLNPGGIRIGTAEIYRQVSQCDEVLESLAIGQDWKNDTRIILFVVLRSPLILDESLIFRLKKVIRENTTARHVPAKIIQVPALPYTRNGKLAELAVRDIVHGRLIKNTSALVNPECLEDFKDRVELLGD